VAEAVAQPCKDRFCRQGCLGCGDVLHAEALKGFGHAPPGAGAEGLEGVSEFFGVQHLKKRRRE
jgi:hypothetical protein